MYSQLGNERYDDHDIFKRQQLSNFHGYSLYKQKIQPSGRVNAESAGYRVKDGEKKILFAATAY